MVEHSSGSAGDLPEDLSFASALDVARAIRRKAISSVELTAQLLERIGRLNAKLNAVVTLAEGTALRGPEPQTTPWPTESVGGHFMASHARSRIRSRPPE